MRNFAHNETHRPFVFVPVQYLEEVRNAPQDKLSLPEYTERAAILNHIMGPRITEEVQSAARLNLNRALNNLVGPIQEQCFNAAKKTMPSSPGNAILAISAQLRLTTCNQTGLPFTSTLLSCSSSPTCQHV